MGKTKLVYCYNTICDYLPTLYISTLLLQYLFNTLTKYITWPKTHLVVRFCRWHLPKGHSCCFSSHHQQNVIYVQYVHRKRCSNLICSSLCRFLFTPSSCFSTVLQCSLYYYVFSWTPSASCPRLHWNEEQWASPKGLNEFNEGT